MDSGGGLSFSGLSRTPLGFCLTLGEAEGGRQPSRCPDPQQTSEPLSAPQRVQDPVNKVLAAPPTPTPPTSQEDEEGPVPTSTEDVVCFHLEAPRTQEAVIRCLHHLLTRNQGGD